MGMEIRLGKAEFFKNLAALQSVVSKKGTIAILANVLIRTEEEAISMAGTDLEIGLRNITAAEVRGAGSICLPAKKIFEIVREAASPEIVIKEKENNWVQVTAGSSVYNLAGMASEEFPAFPEFEDVPLVEIHSTLLSELIEKTLFSIAQLGESRFTLTGALLDKEKKEDHIYFKMISSDGHRLSFMEKEVPEETEALNFDRGIIIPRKAIQEISRICEESETIYFGFDKKQAVVKSNDSIMVARLLTGEFPNYNAIIPQISDSSAVIIDRIVLLDAIRRISLLSEDQFYAINFKLDSNTLVISSQSTDLGNAKDELKVSYSGRPMQVGFNARYFMEILQKMRSDKVKAYVNSEESPCVVKGDLDQGFIAIIMPMKI